MGRKQFEGKSGWWAVGAALLHLVAVAGGADAQPQTAIAMHGSPKFGEEFAQFHSVNPNAPKGGRLVQGIMGSFDSVNPFIIMGVPAAGVRDNVTESLMGRGLDEPFTLYALIAESVEMPDDRSEAVFNINPKARFSDGHPVDRKSVV